MNPRTVTAAEAEQLRFTGKTIADVIANSMSSGAAYIVDADSFAVGALDTIRVFLEALEESADEGNKTALYLLGLQCTMYGELFRRIRAAEDREPTDQRIMRAARAARAAMAKHVPSETEHATEEMHEALCALCDAVDGVEPER